VLNANEFQEKEASFETKTDSEELLSQEECKTN
jgi:hypothetical protein